MADLERGERIRELREARRLTQPAVWERMCAVGGPKRDGKPFISFRMYQRYEEGRGISWEKLRVLAQVLDAGEDYILRGEGERRQPRPARSVDGDIAERLAAIEDRLDALHELRLEEAALLARQTRLLERIERAVSREDELRRLLEETAVRQDQAAREVLRQLEAQQAALAPPAAVDQTTGT